VISSAFNSARGAPFLSKSVRLPLGVVDCALERDCGGSNAVEEDVEDRWDIEREEREEVMDALSLADFELWSSAPEPANVTILTPMPSLLSSDEYDLFVILKWHLTCSLA
jgi:hypothetical protein